MREEFLYVIFLDLHKEYDALDRSRCLEILSAPRPKNYYKHTDIAWSW